MSFPKILLPTITATGLIAGSIITISNLSSSTKSNIQNTQLKKNDNSINNIESKEKTKIKIKQLFLVLNSKFNDLIETIKKRNINSNISLKYQKIMNEMDKIFTSLIPENIKNPVEIEKKIKEVEKDIKDLSNLLEKN